MLRHRYRLVPSAVLSGGGGNTPVVLCCVLIYTPEPTVRRLRVLDGRRRATMRREFSRKAATPKLRFVPRVAEQEALAEPRNARRGSRNRRGTAVPRLCRSFRGRWGRGTGAERRGISRGTPSGTGGSGGAEQTGAYRENREKKCRNSHSAIFKHGQGVC